MYVLQLMLILVFSQEQEATGDGCGGMCYAFSQEQNLYLMKIYINYRINYIYIF